MTTTATTEALIRESAVFLVRERVPAWILEQIDKGWEVYNAPRPLGGTAAPDGMYAGGRGAIPNVPGSRGVFWAAIDPADTYGDRLRTHCVRYGGQRVVVQTEAAIHAAFARECSERGHTVEEIVESFDGDWRGAARSCGYPV